MQSPDLCFGEGVSSLGGDNSTSQRKRKWIKNYDWHGQKPDEDVGDEVGDHQGVDAGVGVAFLDEDERAPGIGEVGPAAEDLGEEEPDRPESHDDERDLGDGVEFGPFVDDEDASVEQDGADFDQSVGGDHQAIGDPDHLREVSRPELSK